MISAEPAAWPRPLAMLLCSALANPAHAACGIPTGSSLIDTVGDSKVARPLSKLGPAIVFTSQLRVNTDGAANSYHPVGTSKGALNYITNAVGIRPKVGPYAGNRITISDPATIPKSERQQLILDAVRASIAKDYAPLPDVTIDWYALEVEKAGLRKGKPCVQQSGPYTDFFVAQTSAVADPSKKQCDPARWVSATEIPYVTLPGGNALAAWGALPGDIGLVHRKVGGKHIFIAVIAGDSGNKNAIGEGSVALHHALGNPSKAQVPPIPGGISGDVTTFLIPKRQATKPITAASLGALTQSLIAELGGRDALIACL